MTFLEQWLEGTAYAISVSNEDIERYYGEESSVGESSLKERDFTQCPPSFIDSFKDWGERLRTVVEEVDQKLNLRYPEVHTAAKNMEEGKAKGIIDSLKLLDYKEALYEYFINDYIKWRGDERNMLPKPAKPYDRLIDIRKANTRQFFGTAKGAQSLDNLTDAELGEVVRRLEPQEAIDAMYYLGDIEIDGEFKGEGKILGEKDTPQPDGKDSKTIQGKGFLDSGTDRDGNVNYSSKAESKSARNAGVGFSPRGKKGIHEDKIAKRGMKRHKGEEGAKDERDRKGNEKVIPDSDTPPMALQFNGKLLWLEFEPQKNPKKERQAPTTIAGALPREKKSQRPEVAATPARVRPEVVIRLVEKFEQERREENIKAMTWRAKAAVLATVEGVYALKEMQLYDKWARDVITGGHWIPGQPFAERRVEFPQKFDMPQDSPLAKFNRLNKVEKQSFPDEPALRQINLPEYRDDSRDALGLRGRFESNEITPDFLKALLKLDSDDQKEVILRLTNSAFLDLLRLVHDAKLTKEERGRLASALIEYRDENARLIPNLPKTFHFGSGGEWDFSIAF